MTEPLFIYDGHESRQGVYRIANVANGRFYIGSASALRTRWLEHASRLQQGTHDNHLIQADYNEFGAGAFTFTVIKVFNTAEDRLSAEDVLIKSNHDGGLRCYNIHGWVTRGSLGWHPSEEQRARSGSSRRGLRRSERAKQKTAETHRGMKRTAEARANIASAAHGRVLTEEHKAKLRAAQLGKKPSAETIEKLRRANVGKTLTEENKAKISAARRAATGRQP